MGSILLLLALGTVGVAGLVWLLAARRLHKQ
jgi:hypothetical protein